MRRDSRLTAAESRNQVKKEKTMNKIFESILIISTGIIIGLFVFSIFSQNRNLSGASDNIITGGMTNASTTVATTTGTLIATRNVSRQYLAICNDDATNPVYLQVKDAVTATTSLIVKEGYKLTAGSCFEIYPPNKLIIQSIYGIASGGTVVVTTLQK